MITADTLQWWGARTAPPPEPWWEIEDRGGFPPFWSFALGAPPLGMEKPWPSEWDRRPHP